MPSNPRSTRVLEPRSLGRTMTLAVGTVKPDRNTQADAVNPREDEGTSSAELTLEDFGGRSDALGG